ncbi:hypothetical protein IKE67_09105 [bacterium]|nr:hypothetical protein [bacterium]
MSTNTIPYKGDNSQAYNKHFLEIDLELDEGAKPPSKVEFVTGCIVKPFVNPQFPIYVDFSESESAKLNYINVGYLITYDDKGRRETAEGSITFKYKNGVICQC